MDDKEEGGQGVTLAEGEEDGEDRVDPMGEERGHNLSVKGGDTASEARLNPMASRTLST